MNTHGFKREKVRVHLLLFFYVKGKAYYQNSITYINRKHFYRVICATIFHTLGHLHHRAVSWPVAMAPDRRAVRKRSPQMLHFECGLRRKSFGSATVRLFLRAECLASAQSGDRRAETWAADARRRPRIALKSWWHARRQDSVSRDWLLRIWRGIKKILWCSEVKCQTICDTIIA